MKTKAIFLVELFMLAYLLSFQSFLHAQEMYHVMSNDDYVELLSKDTMFVTKCQNQLIIEEQIVNGNRAIFGDSITSIIIRDRNMTYCKLLELYQSGSKNLKLYLSAHCENTKLLKKLKSKYPEYWSLTVERRVEIQQRIKAIKNLHPTKAELELIFEERFSTRK